MMDVAESETFESFTVLNKALLLLVKLIFFDPSSAHFTVKMPISLMHDIAADQLSRFEDL